MANTWLSIRAGLALALLCTSWTTAARAAGGYPTKPIHVVVGFAAGGGTDILARLVGQKLSEDLGQPVVIDNKPGASSIIACEYAARAAPDGYTLLMGPTGPMTINPAVYTSLPYATLRDFAPISQVAAFPLILVVSPKLAIASVRDLIAYTKANPAKANYGSPSTAFQLTTELFKQKTGAPVELINYKSSNESVLAVMSGEVLFTITDPAPAAGQIHAGNLRALAVTGARRMPEFPDAPTLAEAGVPDMAVSLWIGLFAPAATPAAIVKLLEDEVIRITRQPDVRARLQTLAVGPTGTSAAEFARIVAADLARWAAVAKAGNIKLER